MPVLNRWRSRFVGYSSSLLAGGEVARPRVRRRGGRPSLPHLNMTLKKSNWDSCLYWPTTVLGLHGDHAMGKYAWEPSWCGLGWSMRVLPNAEGGQIVLWLQTAEEWLVRARMSMLGEVIH